ncbi:DNA mismatch repair protein [Triplophysa tibetana]|uniref:DNA mismatch repair protein n=1 Tax=Triplophysa tibetana TaxID=1572043 RepID=A0A5A9NCQ8_9TELE|nr:DNA mismatch repair protein [Triplophysa tibetana]
MIRSLSTDVRAQLRSGVTIFSLQQCVEELILNSIDSEATCIAIKMENGACRLHVIDNGSGMCREDMEKVGIRYNSSKCNTLEDLDNLRFYGFRGEALSSIISLAETVDINSRTNQTVKTYIKTFNEGKESDVVEVQTVRPSSGTTVSIYNLFYNMPVRRKRLDAVLETERIRQRLEAIALMHPSVSFTLKNENSSHMVVQLSKTRNTYYRFVQIHGLSRAQKLGEVSYIHEQFELTGHVGREGHYNNSLQFLFVNGRLLLKTRIHKLLNCLLKRVSSGAKQNNSLTLSPSTSSPKQRSTGDLYGVYVLNIKCNYAEYDICMEPAKSLIEFKDWDNVIACVEEGVKSFIIKENLETEVMDDAGGSTSSPVKCVKTPAEVRKLNVEETVEGFEALTENKDNADGVEVSGVVQIVVLRNTESLSSEESGTEKAVQNVTLPARTILPVVSVMKNNCKKDDICDKHDANVICAKNYSTDINNNHLTESRSYKISILNEKSSGDSLKYFSTPNKLFSPKRKLVLNHGGGGKLVYINQVTGLSKYNSPLVDTQVPCTTDVTNMVVSVISKTGFEYRCYPFQTNIVLPFLPKPRAERAFCSLIDSKEAVQGPNSLSTLFSEWTNPVFIRPPEVINQVDKKFLACLINATEQETSKSSKNEGNLLVLVDQHAAHERVRLEGLVADSYEDDPDIPGKKRLCSSRVSPPLEISVTEEEMRLLRSCQAFLSDLALDVSFQKSESLNVFLERLPTCFIEKDSTELRRGRRSVIKTFAEEYLREQIEVSQGSDCEPMFL